MVWTLIIMGEEWAQLLKEDFLNSMTGMGKLMDGEVIVLEYVSSWYLHQERGRGALRE